MNKPSAPMVFNGVWTQDSCHKSLKSARDRKRALMMEGIAGSKIKTVIL